MIDAQEQLENIEKAQQKVREGKADKRIDSLEKSKKRLENSFRKIVRPQDVLEEYEEG